MLDFDAISEFEKESDRKTEEIKTEYKQARMLGQNERLAELSQQYYEVQFGLYQHNLRILRELEAFTENKSLKPDLRELCRKGVILRRKLDKVYAEHLEILMQMGPDELSFDSDDPE